MCLVRAAEMGSEIKLKAALLSLGLPGTYGTFGTMSKETVVKNGEVSYRTGKSSRCEKSKVTFFGVSRLLNIAGSALFGIPFSGFGI
jgi:hypothetical protein